MFGVDELILLELVFGCFELLRNGSENILLKCNVVLIVISISRIDSSIVVIKGIFFF